MNESLLYRIGIGLVDGVGDVIAKQLIAYCGGAKAVFKEKRSHLQKVPGVGFRVAEAIRKQDVLFRAEEEIRFIEKNGIRPLFFLDEDYPQRLKFCEDGPLMLYTRGEMNLNPTRAIAIVGTRAATAYGKGICEQLVEQLAPFDVSVISGLAYGIDICAHRACVKNDLSTVGVLAHGLDRLYPAAHAKTAREMESNGGLVTEFMSGTNPDRENFPQRNRIVAGMSDAVIVVESKKRGGALITANLAFDYGREVFAVPGKLGTEQSEGCHHLIKSNKAGLLENIKDLEYWMGWELNKPAQKPEIKAIPSELSTEASTIFSALQSKGELGLDELCLETQLPMNTVTSNLLNLEFSSLVRSLPGKVYSLA